MRGLRAGSAARRAAIILALLGVLGVGVGAGFALASSGPPTPTIGSHPASPTASTAASFSFADSQAGAAFSCSLDGAAFAACTSAKTYTGLAAGSHTFKVEATQAKGGPSAPASYAWTIDLSPPAIAITSPANNAFDNAAGWSAGCASGAGVCGTASDPSAVSAVAVSIKQNSSGRYWSAGGYTSSTEAYQTATLTPTAAGANWFYALPIPAPDGQYTLHVRATDGLGNVTPTGSPAVSTFTVDTVIPPAPSITTSPANPTNQTTASFAFSDTESGVGYLCRLDAGVFTHCSSPASYRSLAQGTHTFYVEGRDAAGNTSPAATSSWVVNTTPPPAPTITSEPVNPSYTNVATFAFADGQVGVSYQCQIDNGGWQACTSPATFTLTVDNDEPAGSPADSDDSHTFRVRAIDAAGNVSAAASYTWTILHGFGAATQIVLSGSTANLASGTTRTFTATIEDAAGNTVTTGVDSTDHITFAKTTSAGTVTGLTSVASVGGVATDTLTGYAAGAVGLRAAGALNGAGRASNTLAFTVTYGAASQLVLSGATTSLASGATRTLTATIEDAAGNTVTGGADSTDPIAFAKTTGTGSLIGLTAVAAVGGAATETVTGAAAGAVNLQASGMLNGVARNSGALTFTVTYGAASQIVLSGSTASLASGATSPYTATIKDAAGNTVTGGADSTDHISFSQSTGAGSISGLSSPAAIAGIASDTVTGNLAGSVTLQGAGTLNSAARTSNTVTFTITYGAATQIVLSGSTANLASGATSPYAATIKDAAGNTVTGGADSTDHITFSQSTGTGSITGLSSPAAIAGVASDTVTGNAAGPVTLQATGTLNSAARTSNTLTFTVTAAAGANFTIGSSAVGPLYPGAAANPVAVTLKNPNSVPIYITSLNATILATSLPAGCNSAWFASTQSNITATQTVLVPANGSVTLPAQGATAPTLQLTDSHTNQDACENASFTLSYTGSAHS